jgi:DNA-binding response OmpR family regulator
MYEEWRVLHVDEDEEESKAFCRALEMNHFAGKCDTVRSITEGRAWLEEALYMPRLRPRPDIVVLNWHAERDDEVLDFARWLRAQPQYREMPMGVWVGPETPVTMRERVRSLEIIDLVNKPEDFEELVEQTEEMLQRCTSRCVAR